MGGGGGVVGGGGGAWFEPQNTKHCSTVQNQCKRSR